MAGETKVILQAASDAWMGASSTVYAINVSTGKGATTLTPLIQMTNGLCIPSGTTIQVADTLEPTINGRYLMFRAVVAPVILMALTFIYGIWMGLAWAVRRVLGRRGG